MIKITGADEIQSFFNSISGKIKKSDINIKRGKKFKSVLLKNVKTGSLGLDKISEASEKISGPHNPEWNTGKLLRAIEIRNINNGVEVGFFKNGKSRTKKLSAYQVALLQHTGYRIPLQGEKGLRVRAFLAVHKIFIKKEKRFLIVKPRPFFNIFFDKYVEMDDDIKIAKRELNKILREA